MTKQIVGAYQKREVAIDKIRDLKIEEYPVEDITIISNRRKAEEIENDTGVEVKRGRPDHKSDDSFMNKVARVFTDDITDPDEQLIALKIPQDQARVHRDDLKSGKFLVVVDNP